MNIRPEEFDLCRQMKDLVVAAASAHDWDPSIIAGIISRESRFGLILDPDLTGDGGHGHGLMQIDDRSFGDWLAANDWRDPAVNIPQGVRILTGKYNYLADKGALDGLSDTDAQRAAIAAYNCGEGNVLNVLKDGDDIDSRTAGGDYSADVLARAAAFKEIFA
jgi:membrane-bound lytic murein transglycosylase MltF